MSPMPETPADQTLDPYLEGTAAWCNDLPQSANPYATREEGSPGFRWREGWKAAQGHAAEAGEGADEAAMQRALAEDRAKLVALGADPGPAMMADLLREALAFEAEAFDAQEEVDAADLLDWFADWRRRVASALDVDVEPLKPQDAAHESTREDVS